MKFLHATIMALALFALTGCGGSKSTALPVTQNPPAFSASAVNDYVKNLSQLANDYVAAAKAKDTAKMTAIAPKFNEAIGKAQTFVTSLKPDEIKKLSDWANTLIQQTRETSAASMLPATQTPPAFSAAAVNDYVKNLSQLANDLVAAAKARDTVKSTALAGQFNEALNKAQTLAASIKPDEIKKLSDWANALIQQTREAANAATTAPAGKK